MVAYIADELVVGIRYSVLVLLVLDAFLCQVIQTSFPESLPCATEHIHEICRFDGSLRHQ